MGLFSNKKSNENVTIKADIWEGLPIPKKHELLAIPLSNTLWHPKVAIYKNNKKTPDWFKEVATGELGLRRCYGLADYMRTGYTIPLWAQLDVREPISKLNASWDARFNTPSYLVEPLDNEAYEQLISKANVDRNQFGYDQAGECPVASMKQRKKSDYLKLQNPWLIKTAPGYSSLFIAPQWEPNSNYSVMAGVVHTDYYHHCNIVLNITTTQPFSIDEGTPMLHVIPFKRESALIKSELLKGDESTHKLLDKLGFDNIEQGHNWKGAYKREQSRHDKELRDIENG